MCVCVLENTIHQRDSTRAYQKLCDPERPKFDAKNITGRSPTTRHNVATGNVLNIFSQPNKPDVPGWTPFFVPVVASPERSFTCNYLNPAGGMRFSQESGEKPNKNTADTTGADQGPVRIINIWWAEEEKKTTGQKLRVDTPSYRGNGSVSELFRNWRS